LADREKLGLRRRKGRKRRGGERER
jgi:hypothetical protein